MKSQRERRRLDRSNWLDAALDALFRDGIEGVRIDSLATGLGVTKGSFYHHFRDRRELLAGMVERWRATQEGYLTILQETAPEDPRERLEVVIDFTVRKDSRHDIAIRAWARNNPQAKAALQAIDQARIALIEGMFKDLGFRGDEARLRGRMLYFYQVGEHSLSVRDPEALRKRLAKLRLSLLAEN